MNNTISILLRIFLLSSLVMGCASKPELHRNIYFQRSWSRATVSSQYLGYRPPAMITPVIMGDQVVTGNGVDGIMVFTNKNGRLVWKKAVRNGAEGVFADSKSGIFLGGNDGKFYYLNSENGSIQWSYSLGSESTSAPLVQGNFIYHVAGNGAFYCLEKESGRVLWVKTRPPKDAITIRGTTPPVFADGKVFVGYSDGYFVAYNAVDGSLVWEKKLSDNKKFNDVDAKPALSDNCIIVANYSDSLYCLDKANGQARWKLEEGGASQPIQIVGNDVIYSTETAIMLVDITSGKPRKRWNIDKKWGQPTMATSYKNWLVFGLSAGPVVLMDKDTGAWDDTFYTGRGVSAAPTVLENGDVYVLSNQANLYKLKIGSLDKSKSWGVLMKLWQLPFWFILLMGCASGQCRRDGSPLPPEAEVKTISEQELENEVIIIGKSDNSLQCGYNVGITMENMGQELTGIQIIKTEKRHDGLMRIQSCGAPTGMMNVYHIFRKDVKKAVKLGYKVLDTTK